MLSWQQDKPDNVADLELARHITYVHMHGKHPELDFEPMPPSFIRAYISEARAVEPFVPAEVSSMLVESYVEMRQSEANAAAAANEQSVMTARRLLSILRMSQALARLRFADRVASEDVQEAIRLVHMSTVRRRVLLPSTAQRALLCFDSHSWWRCGLPVTCAGVVDRRQRCR